MCVVSNVGDDWSRRQKWPSWPDVIPFPETTPAWPGTRPLEPRKGPSETDVISSLLERARLKSENEDLKKQLEETRAQVEQMKQELIEAKAQDIRDGNPDCEMEEKVIVLKKIADIFGIKLTEVFPE